jgi:uncharacterized RmlC-like cupin family protein
MSENQSLDWRTHGVRIVKSSELDLNTPQTPGMTRAAAITHARAGPGDFIFVPPYVPHQEINAKPDEPLMCVLVRSGQEPIVVNLDIPAVEEPEEVYWVDPIHPQPHDDK